MLGSQSDKRVSNTALTKIRKWSKDRGGGVTFAIDFLSYLMQEWCAWELASFVFKMYIFIFKIFGTCLVKYCLISISTV